MINVSFNTFKSRKIMIPGACFPSGIVSKATRYEWSISELIPTTTKFTNKEKKEKKKR